MSDREEEMRRSYYLAASWTARKDARGWREAITEAAPAWQCTSHWIDIDLDTDTMAAIDACGAAQADALVLVGGLNKSPGKHSELGIAIALGVAVFHIRPPGEEPPGEGTHENIFDVWIGSAMAWEEWIAAPFDDWEERRRTSQRLAQAIEAGNALSARQTGRRARGLSARTEGAALSLCRRYQNTSPIEELNP